MKGGTRVRSLKTTAKICLAVICTICFTFNVAMAADFGANAVYNSSSGKLLISGTGSENAQVTVMVMPYTTNPAAITSGVVASGAVIFNMANIDADGEYSIETGLKDTWGGGLYKALIYQGTNEKEVWFTYADSSKLGANLAAINSGDATAIASLIQTKGSDIGAASEHAIAYGADLGKYLYTNKPTSGYTANGYLKAYTAGLAICMVKGGELTLGEAVQKMSNYMDIDLATEYAPYSKEVVADAQRILKLADVAGGSAKELYNTSIVLAQLNLAETDSAMQQVVNDNADVLELDYTTYNTLSNDYKKLQVYANLLNTDFTTVQKFKTDFAASATTVKASDNGPAYVSGDKSPGGIGGGSVVSNTPAAPTTVPGYFNDMSGHWGAAAVNTLVSRGIVGGYPDGTFKPENNVTRAEYAKMLAIALGIPASDYSAQYADVAANDWHAPYVLALSGRGIITGWDGKFDPDGKITRQDATVMTYRAAKAMLTQSGAQASFADEAQIADYAKEAVNVLSSLKVINGYDGKFQPINNTTRAQAATIICNVLTACGIN